MPLPLIIPVAIAAVRIGVVVTRVVAVQTARLALATAGKSKIPFREAINFGAGVVRGTSRVDLRLKDTQNVFRSVNISRHVGIQVRELIVAGASRFPSATTVAGKFLVRRVARDTIYPYYVAQSTFNFYRTSRIPFLSSNIVERIVASGFRRANSKLATVGLAPDRIAFVGSTARIAVGLNFLANAKSNVQQLDEQYVPQLSGARQQLSGIRTRLLSPPPPPPPTITPPPPPPTITPITPTITPITPPPPPITPPPMRFSRIIPPVLQEILTPPPRRR